MKKIKIGYILPRMHIGGAERFVIDLINNLDQEKFEPKIYFLKEAEAGQSAWLKELEENKIAYTVIGKKTKLGLGCLIKLAKALRADQTDVVHTQIFSGDFYGRIAGKLAGVKATMSTAVNIFYFEGRIKIFFKRLTEYLNDGTASIGQAVSDYLIKTGGVKKEKLRTIPNGVEINKFLNKNRVYENKEKIIVGFTGRLVEQKGLEYLIEAMALIDDDRIVCEIVGSGELKEKLQKQIANSKIANRVKLLGLKDNPSQFLNAIDIYCLPSRWEGFGIVLLEAGLAGLPVVASRVDGIKEVISDNEDGLLFEKGNAKELAEKIKYLANHPETREKLGQNLQAKVIKKYDIKIVAKMYEDYYLALLK